MNKKLNVAYIAYGKSPNRYHIPYILANDEFVIKKVYVRKLENIKYEILDGVSYTDDLNDILNDLTLNLVVVTSPFETHYYYTKILLESHHNVLVEKPFVVSVLEAKELYEIARKNQKLLYIFHNRRYDSDFLITQEVIESAKLGKIFEVQMNFDYYRYEQNLDQKFRVEDSFLYGHGSHMLDQAISYFGIPKNYNTVLRSLFGVGNKNDYFEISLEYSDLRVILSGSFLRLVARPSFVVYGTNGVFKKETNDRQETHLKAGIMPGEKGFGKDSTTEYGKITYLVDGIIMEETVVTKNSSYYQVYQDIYECLTTGKIAVQKEVEIICQISILEKAINDYICQNNLKL